MARSKKALSSKNVRKAMARDRKRIAEKKMRVSGKGVFVLAKLQDGVKGSKKNR